MDEKRRAWLAPRAEVFKALGHPTRLFIARKLRDAPHCVCELTELVGADTSTVSKHLSVLRNAGLVRSHREGATIYYSLVCDCLGDMLDAVAVIVSKKAAEA